MAVHAVWEAVLLKMAGVVKSCDTSTTSTYHADNSNISSLKAVSDNFHHNLTKNVVLVLTLIPMIKLSALSPSHFISIKAHVITTSYYAHVYMCMASQRG